MNPFSQLLRDSNLKVYTRTHPLEIMRPYLDALGFVKASDLKGFPHGTEVLVAGLVVLVHNPPVKSGKRVMFVTLEDETGLIDLVIPPESLGECAKEVVFHSIAFLSGKVEKTMEAVRVNVTSKAPCRLSLKINPRKVHYEYELCKSLFDNGHRDRY